MFLGSGRTGLHGAGSRTLPPVNRIPGRFAVDKYLHIKENPTLPQIVEHTEPEAQREIIRLALDELASEVGTALHDACLDFPVYVAIPNSGDSLATIATPLDPTSAAAPFAFFEQVKGDTHLPRCSKITSAVLTPR